ncbi:MAG: hypothetical protein ACLGJB_17740 [Blastocatellia bacterium]
MKKRKVIKLSRIEQAIVVLAEEIESCPLYEYKLRQRILDILGYEEIKEKA